MRGAEAILRKEKFCGKAVLVKERIRKKYRHPKLDERLRKTRTRIEARLLSKAKEGGIRCPLVYAVSDYGITMEKLPGELLSTRMKKQALSEHELNEIARMLASLHSLGIVHGDFTPANILVHGKEISLIDFGLGGFSSDIEEKAIDVLTMKKALGKIGDKFPPAYAKYGSPSVVSRAKEIEKRGRYVVRAMAK